MPPQGKISPNARTACLNYLFRSYLFVTANIYSSA